MMLLLPLAGQCCTLHGYQALASTIRPTTTYSGCSRLFGNARMLQRYVQPRFQMSLRFRSGATIICPPVPSSKCGTSIAVDGHRTFDAVAVRPTFDRHTHTRVHFLTKKLLHELSKLYNVTGPISEIVFLMMSILSRRAL